MLVQYCLLESTVASFNSSAELANTAAPTGGFEPTILQSSLASRQEVEGYEPQWFDDIARSEATDTISFVL